MRGLWRADELWAQQHQHLHTSSVQFRDELTRMLLHAGYATHFICTQRAGERLAEHDHWRVVFAEADAASGVNAGHPCMARADIRRITDNNSAVWSAAVGAACASRRMRCTHARSLVRSLACCVAGAWTWSTTTT